MRKDFGVKDWVVPQSVLMIATYDENGKVNVMNAAWGGICDSDKIALNLSHHKTTENMFRTRAFTISMATKKTVVESDYFGIVSGNKVPDKFLKSGFHAHKSANINAPVIDEYPLTFECALDEVQDVEGDYRVIGRIVNVTIDESVLTDGKLDLNKLQPVIYNSADHSYYVIGEKVAPAFSIGLSLTK